jgi:CheY-like chemotaxis protein
MIALRLAQGRIADVERYLVSGAGATRRAAALTHRLLAFSRRQTLSPKALLINDILADFAELVERTVGPAYPVIVATAADLHRTLVDANQLENALLNLCINARDAMPDGGAITIETHNCTLGQSEASEMGLDPGDYVRVSVADRGSGIDKSLLHRVFDPFFTTKPIGQGTGLGLSMVYGFARQSQGHVRIESEIGEGTTVSLYLPAHASAVDGEPGSEIAGMRGPGAGETVLVVDDEPSVRMLVTDALSELGYACVEANDGPAALKLLNSKLRVDLLVTDVGLPGGLNGRQVADAARARRPELKVLFVTGYAENAVLAADDIERGMEVLIKPFTIDQLGERVTHLLRAEDSGVQS